MRRRLVALGALAAYTAGAFALFHAAWADPGRRLIGRCCDSSAYVDTFRWTGTALLHGHDPLFSHLVYVPTGVNVMWQPNVLVPLGVLATPFEPWIGPMATYNLLMTMGLALSAFSCFLVLRRLVGGTVGPFVGGAFFGFSPVMTSHSLGHAQITWALLVPLAVLLTIEILVDQTYRWWCAGALLGAAMAVQLLMGEEVLAGIGLTYALLALALALRFHRSVGSKVAHAGKALGAAVVVFVALAAVPLGEQFFGGQRLHGAVRNTSIFTTNLAAYVTPVPETTEFSTSWTARHAGVWFASIGYSETNAYLGVTLLVALAVVVVACRRKPIVQVTAAVTLVLALLGLGTHLQLGARTYGIPTPWRVVHALPLLDSLQPNRLALFVDLGVAVLIAVGIRGVASWRARAARAAGGVAVVVALAPLLPTLHYPVYEPKLPSFFTTSAVDVIPAGSVALVAPFPRGSGHNDTPMIWQSEADLRFAMPGGGVAVPDRNGHYTREGGTDTAVSAMIEAIAANRPVPPQTRALLAAERQDLVDWGVRSVVVGPMPHETGVVDLFIAVLGAPPRSVGGVYVWTDVRAGRIGAG